MSEQNCGLESIKSFIEVVDKVCETGRNMEIFSRSLDEIVPDYKDDNILKALPQVYPYGFGWPNDMRYDSKGCISYQWSLEDYLVNVSILSKPSIQESLFSLVIFNVFINQKMVKMLSFRSGSMFI